MHGYTSQPSSTVDPVGLSCCKNLPDFCQFDIGSGFSGVYDAATGSIVVLPGGNASIWGVPFEGGVAQFGGHAIGLKRMQDILGSAPDDPWGFSMTKGDNGYDFGFNSRTINSGRPGVVGDRGVPMELREKIVEATGQSKC